MRCPQCKKPVQMMAEKPYCSQQCGRAAEDK
jgi:endogenous inhibitor of DNA gyrase (YacG/DUF329 family)